MIDNASITAITWGFLGAIVYAGPKLILCRYASIEANRPGGRCYWEAIMAVATGMISAAAFGSTVSAIAHLPDPRATCTVIGFMANRTAPYMANAFRNQALRMLGLTPTAEDAQK